MKKVLLKNAKLHNRSKGLLSCGNCGMIMCNIGEGTVGYKMAFVCKCSAFGKAEYNGEELPELVTDAALYKNNKVACPGCGNILSAVPKGNAVKTAFIFKCECGVVCHACRSDEHECIENKISGA